ncbi:ankyrin-3-like isoform X2 [Mercenaria mercenaria]|nr:ankyrin-3-like isoform X2 [Mercenaria mercenaria]XP_045214468.2 ankyrin-3-like isoform X2 [Mercenaria mercenaria]XP_045214469.2 ankyrin-3-like isoform X2 [Mercenaria mercenaria]XP_053393375.1 ankyrin-3-like isoform X2 [Mercenaria mercenaria]
MRRRHQLSNINDIFLTVVNGNLHGLKNYLTNGGNVNLQDRDAVTLLHKAAEEGDISKVKVLLEHGCCVDSQDKDGCTPVYVAVSKGHHSILKVLLEAGSFVNTVANQHTTPLILAVIKKDRKSVRLLLDCSKSCDIDMENYFLQSALTQAIVSNNQEICEMLLSSGASVKCIYNKSFSLEVARVLCQNIELMKLFLKYSKRMDLNYHLMIACIYKKLDVAEMVLHKFDDPFQRKALGFVTKQEEDSVWERLTKSVVQPYKLATKCSKDNKFLMMLFNFCISEHNQDQRRNHKLRAIAMIRILMKYGLVIHPQTSVKQCHIDCECRKSIFTAQYDSDVVTSLKGQCCSVIRQTLRGDDNFELQEVAKLPVPKALQQFICMADW